MPDLNAMLFAYGSLQLPEVFKAVTALSREAHPAVLRGFRRTKLRGFGFPAIVPAEQEETSGILYHRIDEDAWRRLDSFEDDFYDRVSVKIELPDGSTCTAFTYVLTEGFRYLSLDASWSLSDLDSWTIRDLLARLEPS